MWPGGNCPSKEGVVETIALTSRAAELIWAQRVCDKGRVAPKKPMLPDSWTASVRISAGCILSLVASGAFAQSSHAFRPRRSLPRRPSVLSSRAHTFQPPRKSAQIQCLKSAVIRSRTQAIAPPPSCSGVCPSQVLTACQRSTTVSVVLAHQALLPSLCAVSPSAARWFCSMDGASLPILKARVKLARRLWFIRFHPEGCHREHRNP